jgi:YfiH family protein
VSPPILSPWNFPGLVHGFLGRRGGVSHGVYSTLNLSQHVGDDPAAVEENWRRVRAIIGNDSVFARRNQVHGNHVQVVTRANASAWEKADGLATCERGITVGVFSADCVPMLMIEPNAGAVAAIHAGWRGTIAGIAASGVAAMRSLGAKTSAIRVALGPSIGPCCFEVDASLADRFEGEVDGAGAHRRAGKPGKAYLDLRGILTDQLDAVGVARANIEAVGPCTRCANDAFFSRRAAGGDTSGLQLSFIGWRPGS